MMPVPPPPLKVGMEHELYQWSHFPLRPKISWPDDAPLSLSVIILLEHVEAYPPGGLVHPPISGGFGQLFPFPNLPLMGHREYGNRVGIFRILNVLEKHGIVPTIAADAMAAERFPHIVETGRKAGAEFVAHGLSLNRAITSQLSEEAEKAYIDESLERLRAATGETITGWMGPEQCESHRTLGLLDAAGLDYVCDWPNDEQPYFMSTPSRLVSVPPTWGLDDGYAVWHRPNTPDAQGNVIRRCGLQLIEDGAENARSLVLILRPWLSGQSFRIDGIDAALGAIMATGKAWAATTGDVARAYRVAMA
jgi:allantoinase